MLMHDKPAAAQEWVALQAFRKHTTLHSRHSNSCLIKTDKIIAKKWDHLKLILPWDKIRGLMKMCL